MAVCPHCGAENRPGSNFCRKCGRPLDSAARADASDGSTGGDVGDFGVGSPHGAAGVGGFNFGSPVGGTAHDGASSFSAPDFPAFNFTPPTDSASFNKTEDLEVSSEDQSDVDAAAAQSDADVQVADKDGANEELEFQAPSFAIPTFAPPPAPQSFTAAAAEDSDSASSAAPEAQTSSDATAPEAVPPAFSGAPSTSSDSADPSPMNAAPASPAPSNPVGASPMAEDQYGSACAWHPHRPKATTCAKCGRSLCDECQDALTVSGGEYEGQPLCYSCLNELAASEAAEFQKNCSTITRRNVVALVFMVVGLVIGLVHGRNEGRGAALLVFNCILDALVFGGLPNYPHCLAEDVKKCNTGSVGTTIVRFIATLIGDLFKAMFRTLGQFARYRRYTNGAHDLLAQNQAALQQVNAFMAYTRLHDDNGGLDLDALMSEHQELYSNPYAQQLRTNGERTANESVRSGCSRIVQNAATIADFAA